MKTKTARKLNAVPSPTEAAKEWAEIRAQIEVLERRKGILKDILEGHLSSLPDRQDELGGYQCTLVRNEREYFALAKAKEKLDLRILKPFITKAKFVTLRLTYKGEVL